MRKIHVPYISFTRYFQAQKNCFIIDCIICVNKMLMTLQCVLVDERARRIFIFNIVCTENVLRCMCSNIAPTEDKQKSEELYCLTLDLAID